LLPLTVWLCSDTGQRAPVGGGEESGKDRGGLCVRHRHVVGHELARHLIACCTGEGDLVTEAYTASEATLAAAADLGRRAIACVSYPPLARHIGARLRATVTADRLTGLAMRPTTPECLASGLADYSGKVQLVIAAPPPHQISGRAGPAPGTASCLACQAEVWVVSDRQLRAFLLASWRVLARGGHLAVITTARHEGGRLVDPAPVLIRQARALGFRYTQHVIALRVPVRGDELIVQAGPGEIAQVRDAGCRTLPPAVTVHGDVCLFTKPAQTPGRPAAEGGRR
jgi:hypothetical protein